MNKTDLVNLAMKSKSGRYLLGNEEREREYVEWLADQYQGRENISLSWEAGKGTRIHEFWETVGYDHFADEDDWMGRASRKAEAAGVYKAATWRHFESLASDFSAPIEKLREDFDNEWTRLRPLIECSMDNVSPVEMAYIILGH